MYFSFAFPNDPSFVKWPASSLDDMDLFEQRLADWGNVFSEPWFWIIAWTDDDDGVADELSSTFDDFFSVLVAADVSLSVRWTLRCLSRSTCYE